ncbi:sigma-70 family RNA polymerase sigma factor [Streptomyces sp. NA02536]|uniref:sigma-70 family RNA polymerase sigma factor n=1 Tax=Streptomyces sp. NA02536 TaxID=2742133 RepID=UPI0015903F9F|nr:sigma-70 family RNA polymerase sigma factor [Streptomyces sp. NA02536]QKW03943.1 sigma-70 family RNA polymerase sigma factor [Streptomyces sp. NA02536]
MSTSAADVIRTRDAAAPEPTAQHLDALLRELSEQPQGPRRAALRDDVIRRLLPVAHRVTRRFRRHGEEWDDLVQVASLGLIKAVDGYDPARGHAFLSYALPKVTGEVRRHLRDRTAAVRLPRPLQEAAGQVFRAVEELEQRLDGHPPTTEQIAEHTGLGADRVLSALRAVHECRPRSLDAPAGGGRDVPACPLGAEDPALGLVVDTVSLASLVRRLPERDRRVLHLRFYREQSQREIAEAVGVSQMQVSRILRRCLGRLREALLASEPRPEAGEAVQARPAPGPPARRRPPTPPPTTPPQPATPHDGAARHRKPGPPAGTPPPVRGRAPGRGQPVARRPVSARHRPQTPPPTTPPQPATAHDGAAHRQEGPAPGSPARRRLPCHGGPAPRRPLCSRRPRTCPRTSPHPTTPRDGAARRRKPGGGEPGARPPPRGPCARGDRIFPAPGR